MTTMAKIRMVRTPREAPDSASRTTRGLDDGDDGAAAEHPPTRPTGSRASARRIVPPSRSLLSRPTPRTFAYVRGARAARPSRSSSSRTRGGSGGGGAGWAARPHAPRHGPSRRGGRAPGAAGRRVRPTAKQPRDRARQRAAGAGQRPAHAGAGRQGGGAEGGPCRPAVLVRARAPGDRRSRPAVPQLTINIGDEVRSQNRLLDNMVRGAGAVRCGADTTDPTERRHLLRAHHGAGRRLWQHGWPAGQRNATTAGAGQVGTGQCSLLYRAVCRLCLSRTLLSVAPALTAAAPPPAGTAAARLGPGAGVRRPRTRQHRHRCGAHCGDPAQSCPRDTAPPPRRAALPQSWASSSAAAPLASTSRPASTSGSRSAGAGASASPSALLVPCTASASACRSASMTSTSSASARCG